MNIELDNVSKNFKNQTVLENVNLKLESGKIYGLVGRNGSGKSVLLKIMTGLMEPSDGIIKYGGIPLKKGQYAKDVGIVLDCIGFMPEYTAKENLLLLAKINKKTGEERINEILKQVGLEPDSKKVYRKFSLGMKQKLAIAQAFMEKPKVLLLDEPLGALDLKLRKDMQRELKNIQKELGITFIYVTHDQEEAMAISDRIAVMKDGVIQHVGTPRDIYQRPKNVFVATFIGRTNIVNAHVKGGVITFADGYHEHIDALDKAAEQDVRCSIRPEEFIICKDGTDGIHGTVQECTYLGLNTHYTIDTDQGDSVEIVEESSIGEGLKKGEKVLLKVKKEKINVFTKDGGTNLIRSDAYEKQ